MFWKLLFDTLIDAPSCLSPDPEGTLSDQTITVETAGKLFCGKLTHGRLMWPTLSSSFWLSVKYQAESPGVEIASMCYTACLSLLQWSWVSKKLYVCFLFSIQPVKSQLWLLWILNTVCDSLMVEMKSRKRSFGKRGFSSPLKYSFSTPATELISWSFWSSIRGSSPD